MKKQVAAAAAAALALTGACALAGTAMADDMDMDVRYTATSTYNLSIPSNVRLTESGAKSAKIGVRSANIAPGKTLSITATSDGYEGTGNTLTLANEADPSVKAVTSVTDEAGAALANGGVAATFTGLVESESTKTVNFSAVKDAAGRGKVQAGNYKTVMTFTGSIR